MTSEPGRDAARAAALHLLRVRPRSRRELLTRLGLRGISPEEAQAVADDLERDGWLDDRQFARLWANWRMNSTPMGRARLEMELGSKGIDRDIIRTCLDELFQPVSELETAIELAAVRLARTTNRSEAGRKLWSFLRRRGFSAEVASEAIAKALGRERV